MTESPNWHQEPVVLLDGRYGLPGGLPDAVGAVLLALMAEKGDIHVTVTRLAP